MKKTNHRVTVPELIKAHKEIHKLKTKIMRLQSTLDDATTTFNNLKDKASEKILVEWVRNHHI